MLRSKPRDGDEEPESEHMVARDDRHGPLPDDAASPGVLWWRDWRRRVSRNVRWRPPARPRPLVAARLAIAYLRAPARTLARATGADRMRLVTAGALALSVGALASLALAIATGGGWVPSLLYVAWLVAWALARLAVLRLTAPARDDRSPRLVEAAWGPALLPFALALASPLDLLALAASAALTYVGLGAVGYQRRDAIRCVAWAFGGQLAVEVAAWIARGAFFVLAR